MNLPNPAARRSTFTRTGAGRASLAREVGLAATDKCHCGPSPTAVPSRTRCREFREYGSDGQRDSANSTRRGGPTPEPIDACGTPMRGSDSAASRGEAGRRPPDQTSLSPNKCIRDRPGDPAGCLRDAPFVITRSSCNPLSWRGQSARRANNVPLAEATPVLVGLPFHGAPKGVLLWAERLYGTQADSAGSIPRHPLHRQARACKFCGLGFHRSTPMRSRKLTAGGADAPTSRTPTTRAPRRFAVETLTTPFTNRRGRSRT
jgi:hypothetical protein